MKNFQNMVEENFATLDMYTKAITRAHGKNHPEAFEVRELFERINEKVKVEQDANLVPEFQALREVTNGYTIPNDVCETYEAVYNMLSEADKLYHH